MSHSTSGSNPVYDFKSENSYQNNSGKTSTSNIDLEAQNQQWGSFGSGLTDKIIRIKFIRKVYLIVTTQLLFTFGICLLFAAVEPIRRWVTESNSGLALYLLS